MTRAERPSVLLPERFAADATNAAACPFGQVLASAAPYARPHVRLTPSIRKSPEEVEFALQAVRALA